MTPQPQQAHLPMNHDQHAQGQQQGHQTQISQPQVQQHPVTPPADQSHPPVMDRHDDEMDMVSQDGSGEGDLSFESKAVDRPFVPLQAQGTPMSPPPEGQEFPTMEALHKYVLSYCTSVGYAVVIGRSKKTVPGLKKVLFVCDRSGKPPRRSNPEMRKRKTTSRKCECPFGFFAIEQRTQWTIRYRPDTIHLTHNHEPSESPQLHPAARKLDSQMVARVKELKENGK
jgi:hypothetical protein